MDKLLNKFEQSQVLFARAEVVIPCGIYGHTTPAMLVPGAFPYYAGRAKGSHYWDVDNNEYIDWLCGYGPVVLGHQHPIVEEAALRMQQLAICANHPTPIMIELAEYLVDLVDFSAWAVFGKNGSDMTTWAIQVARDYTGRKKILKTTDSYHGTGSWCTPGHAGLIAEDTLHIHDFTWNDLNSFDAQIKKFRNQLAAVILSPFHHPAFAKSELPNPGFFKHIENICRREGIVLILDDIRAGFRLHHGGSHRYFDFEPDLICFCKAIANGHPLSATLGKKELRIAASRVFLTGSYWNNPVPMAAALTCLQILAKENAVEKMRLTGEQLMNGLIAAAKEYNYNVIASGPPAIPFLTFEDDPGLHLQQNFCVEMVQRGVFVHPHHNWFISTAHSQTDIADTIHIAKLAFASMREKSHEHSHCS